MTLSRDVSAFDVVQLAPAAVLAGSSQYLIFTADKYNNPLLDDPTGAGATLQVLHEAVCSTVDCVTPSPCLWTCWHASPVSVCLLLYCFTASRYSSNKVHTYTQTHTDSRLQGLHVRFIVGLHVRFIVVPSSSVVASFHFVAVDLLSVVPEPHTAVQFHMCLGR